MDPFEHFHDLDVGPAVQRPPEAQTAAAQEANRLAFAEPTTRTVEVLQFCSWSACRMNSRFSASSTSRVTMYWLYGSENIMCRKLAQ